MYLKSVLYTPKTFSHIQEWRKIAKFDRRAIKPAASSEWTHSGNEISGRVPEATEGLSKNMPPPGRFPMGFMGPDMPPFPPGLMALIKVPPCGPLMINMPPHLNLNGDPQNSRGNSENFGKNHRDNRQRTMRRRLYSRKTSRSGLPRSRSGFTLLHSKPFSAVNKKSTADYFFFSVARKA